MDLERARAVKYAKLIGTGVIAFVLMFGTGYLIFPNSEYSSDFSIEMDRGNPEKNVTFDDREISLGYNSTGPDYAIINGSKQTFELEGRQNEILAVDGKVYMLYFESAGDYLRLLRIEEL